MAKLIMTPKSDKAKTAASVQQTPAEKKPVKLVMTKVQQPQRSESSGVTRTLPKATAVTEETPKRQTSGGLTSQPKGVAIPVEKATTAPVARGSSYLTGGAATPAPSYGAGVQARELKELDIKPREKKTSTEPQKAQTPAWQGLMGLSAAELEQRHEKAKAERDVLSSKVAREETPAVASSYAAVAGLHKAKEVNPIPSVAAASGAWVSEEDKRLAPLRMDVSRKQDEVNDLATAHYHRKNQEQFAKLETDAASKAKFRSAQELASDLDAISKALSAPTTYNGQDTRFKSDGEAMKQKYGVDDLQALQRTLTAQKAGLVKELEAKGYDFETMAGYDLMLRQQEEYIKRQEQTQKDAEAHPVSASGLSVVLKPLQPADFFRTVLNGVGHSDADDLGSYVPANVYDMHTTNMVQTIRGTVSKKIEENTDWEIFGQNVGSFLYNTGMSMADSALMVTTLGPGSTYLMGLSSAANKSKEIIEQGGSNQQAFWGGLTAGVAEYVFEKFSVDNLLAEKSVTGWKSFIKETLKQGGIEASEEMLTECANIISDAMVMGERSGLSTAIKGYQEQGMTEDEAVLQACLDSIGQVAVAGVGGFISGVGMGAGKLGIEQGSQAIYDRLTQRGGEAVQFGAQQGEGARFDAQTGVDTPAVQNAVDGEKTASTGEAGEYRVTRPQNVEMPTVPIIDLSVSDIPGQGSPVLTAGNSLRASAIERARRRLGLDKNSAAYIPASNVTRDGHEYVLKITKASLTKMLSPTDGGAVSLKSISVMDNLERIANNGVWFESQGDRKGRPQIAGFDHLKTTVYIDGVPHEVDMRVRLVEENPGKGADNVLYYFTPEEILTIEKVGTEPPTYGRRASVSHSEVMPTSEVSIPQTAKNVNPDGGVGAAPPQGVSAEDWASLMETAPQRSQRPQKMSDAQWAAIMEQETEGTKRDPNAWRRLTAEEQQSVEPGKPSTDILDDEAAMGGTAWWDSLMETAERGEAVDQTEVERPEDIIRRDSKGLAELIESLNKVNPAAEVRTELQEEKRTVGQKMKDAVSSVYRQFVDSGAEVEKMGKELGDKSLYPYYNAARSASNAAGYMLQSGGVQMSVDGEVVGKSLADIFQPIRERGDGYYTEFQEYLYHLHNVDRMSRDNSTNISEALRQLNEFDEMMAQTRPDLATMPESDLAREATFGDAAAQQRLELLNAYNEAKAIRNKPVFDQEVGAAQSREAAERLLAAHPEFQELAGEVYQYSDNLLQYRVDSGLVTQEFADMLREIYPHYVPTYRVTEGVSAGSKKKGTQVGKTVGRATGGNSDLMPLHTALARQTAQVVRNGTLNRLGQRLLADYNQSVDVGGKYIYNVQETTQGLHENTFDMLEDVTPERENTFTIYKDGKAIQMTVSKGMAQAIDALTPKKSGWRSEDSYKIPAKATSLFKELTTGKNPGFLVRNFFRDFQEGVVYSESTLRWLKNFPKAYEGIIKNSADWQLFQANGGVFSSVFDYQKGYHLEEGGKNAAQRFIGKVEAANSVIEMAPRFAEFLAYLEKHGRSQDSIIEAVNRAAEVTTNFGKGGEAGKFLNRTFVPFLNPGIQGANKMVKTALGRNGAKACAKLWLLGAGMLGLGVRALNDLVNGDDDEYEYVRDSVKDTNWLIPAGDGKYIKIPMGRDASSLGIIFSRLIAMAHGDKVDWGDAANTIISQSAPSNPLKTNILSAALDSALFDPDNPGKTWYGGDIESQRLQNLAPGQRFDEDTDYFSKWLGGVLNVSPKKINYVLDQYSGVVGEYVLPLITPSKNKSIVSTFTSNFVLDSVTSNSLSSDFYGKADQIKYAKNGGDGAMNIVNRFWSKQSSAVSDLNKALRELENDTTIPNKEKQEKIREAKAVIGGVQKNALEAMEAYEAAARKYYTGDSEAEIALAYREANREVFGAEYALRVHDKDIYERAVAVNEGGVSFDAYYEAYFATRGKDGKQMKDNEKRKVLMGMDLTDKEKIALYRDLISDGRDDDIAAAQSAGLSFNKFMEAQNRHSDLNNADGLTNSTKRAEFAKWLNTQLLTAEQKSVLQEAFGFYTFVRANESKYEILTEVGYDSDTAWNVAQKMDALTPPTGKDTVTALQKSRVIVDNVSDNPQRLAALAEFVDESTYNKLEIGYQSGIDPKVYVFFKGQVEDMKAKIGKDSLTQSQTEAILRKIRLTDKERAVLWQLQNTGWKPASNPFNQAAGQKVYNLYQQRKGSAEK